MSDNNSDEMVVDNVDTSVFKPEPEEVEEQEKVEPEEVSEVDEDEEPEETEEDETEEPTEQDESEEDEDSETEEDEGEDFISIDGETPPSQEEEEDNKPAPKWVKDLRKQNRERAEENRRLKAELEQLRNGEKEEPPVTLPDKPKLSDYDYDEEEFDKAVEQWHDKKVSFETKQRQEREAKEQVQAEQQKQAEAIKNNYDKSKNALRVRDYDVVEEIVSDKLPTDLQNVILLAADNPAAVVYALGKNASKLEELSKVTDPLRFAKELGKLEGKLKVERRKAPPAPEKKVKGSAKSSSVDSTLEALRKEAEKTGNYSKVMAYRRNNKG